MGNHERAINGLSNLHIRFQFGEKRRTQKQKQKYDHGHDDDDDDVVENKWIKQEAEEEKWMIIVLPFFRSTFSRSHCKRRVRWPPVAAPRIGATRQLIWWIHSVGPCVYYHALLFVFLIRARSCLDRSGPVARTREPHARVLGPAPAIAHTDVQLNRSNRNVT